MSFGYGDSPPLIARYMYAGLDRPVYVCRANSFTGIYIPAPFYPKEIPKRSRYTQRLRPARDVVRGEL